MTHEDALELIKFVSNIQNVLLTISVILSVIAGTLIAK